MGFLKRFFHNVLCDGDGPMERGVPDRMPRVELESHLSVARYGDFLLTEAVRPAIDLPVVPKEGYRRSRYDDPNGGTIPVLIASVSREKLFDAFLELLDPLGPTVDVILETSHARYHPGREELCRERIDLPILKSYLYDHEEVLMNDGCTGIAVVNPEMPMEVQFDEHKLLIVYAEETETSEAILKSHGVFRCDRMRFLTEAEHLHSSRTHYAAAFHSLRRTLGIDCT